MKVLVNLKGRFKRVLVAIVVLFCLNVTYNIVDKYFNKGSAEANLTAHIAQLYGKVPTALSCANVDTGNHDSRVACEVVLEGKTKAYLCKGLFDNFDNSCIPMKGYMQAN